MWDPPRWLQLLAAAAVYAIATLWLTWPLARFAPERIYDGGGGMWSSRLRADLLLMVWIMRWDLHVLATDPLNLFNANIFHPARGTLALSEHLLGGLPLFGPVWGVTGNPILAFNIWVLGSFVLAGIFMHMLVQHWTGSTVAAYVGGLAFAFAPWRIPDGLGRAHLLQVEYFPLIVLALERAARTASLRAALVAASLLTLQTLCSYYVGYQAFAIAGVFLGVDVVARGVRGRGASLRALAVAILAPLVVLLPLAVPYVLARAQGELTVAHLGAAHARVWGPVAVAGVVMRKYVGSGTLGIGLLSLVALPRLWRIHRAAAARLLVLLGVAVAGVALAAGPGAVPYDWIAAVVPGFGSIRAPVRFGSLASFGMSGLAAASVAGAWAWLPRRGGWAWLRAVVGGGAAVVVVLSAASAGRLGTRRVPVGRSIPAPYRWLAAHGDGQPLLELPVYTHTHAEASALAMYYSTYHWLPLLNGYSGYLPGSYEFLAAYAEQLPSSDALRLLVDCTGVRWVLVHSASPERLRAWGSTPGVRSRGSYERDPRGMDRLYEITAASKGPRRCNLRSPRETVEGHRIVRLGRLAGRLAVTGVPARVRAGQEGRVRVRLENHGLHTWPCTATSSEAAVTLKVRWLHRFTGGALRAQTLRLPRDVAPHEHLVATLWLRYPRTPGLYRLHVELSQNGARTPAAGKALRWETLVVVLPIQRDHETHRRGASLPAAPEPRCSPAEGWGAGSHGSGFRLDRVVSGGRAARRRCGAPGGPGPRRQLAAANGAAE